MIGRFVAPVLEGGDPFLELLDGGSDAAEIFGHGGEASFAVALRLLTTRDFGLEPGQPFLRSGQGGFLIGRLGPDLLFLAQEELELLFDLDRVVPFFGEVLELAEVFVAKGLDLRPGGGGPVPGFADRPGGRFDFGVAVVERAGQLFELARGLPGLEIEGQHLLAKLLAAGFGLAAGFLEIFRAFGFPFDLALQAGGLGFQGVDALLVFLERLLQVPEGLADLGQVLFLDLDPADDLMLLFETGVVGGLRLFLGLDEAGVLPDVVDRGQLADPFAEPPVAGRGRCLALEGVLGLFDFADDVLEADEVLLARLELVLGLPFLVLVVGRAGGLFEQGPLFGRLGGDEGADGALLDDEVLGLADGMLP